MDDVEPKAIILSKEDMAIIWQMAISATGSLDESIISTALVQAADCYIRVRDRGMSGGLTEPGGVRETGGAKLTLTDDGGAKFSGLSAAAFRAEMVRALREKPPQGA